MKRLRGFILFALVLSASLAGLIGGSSEGGAEEVRYDSGGRRDPFIPLVSKEGVLTKSFDSSGLHVEGIVFDPHGESLALISGEYYRKGAVVAGATILDILRDRVIVKKDDEEKTLWFEEDADTQNKVTHAA